jgi:MFS family permease
MTTENSVVEGKPSILSASLACWALLISMALSSVSNGLQGTLLGLRASFEGFDTATTGFIMSGYFVGFLVSSVLTPRLLERVGHIRVFAALASLASVAPLLHGTLVDPFVWFGSRLVTGFCFAGIFVIAESWLNDRATNETRGGLLSIYMIFNVGGMGLGPLLLNFLHPMTVSPFIFASVLISIAMIPLLLAASQAPNFEAPEKLSALALYRLSPLGLVAMVGVGMSNGALVGMGAVFADGIGMSIAQVSILISLVFLGSVLFQVPIGLLSDKFDRRLVITVVTFVAAALTAVGATLSLNEPTQIMGLFCIFGGLSFPMYSLCLSHANDRLNPKQMVAAGSTLLLAAGVGAITGPPGVSFAMNAYGTNGFLWYFVVVHCVIGVFALYRISSRGAAPSEDREATAFSPQTATFAPAFNMETIIEITESGDGPEEDSDGSS